MSKDDTVKIPSEDIWNSMREVKKHTTRHITITTGDQHTIVDAPLSFNLRVIPRVFTAPLQALGMVTSIFARMTNTRITLNLKNDENS